MNKNHKRISAAVLALALGFSAVGAPVLAPMASAQTIEIEADDVSTVNMGADVSLTINKYEGLPVTDPADLDDLERLPGFEFLIEKVEGINLSTTAGWEAVANLNPADTAGLSLTEIDTITTDADGVATINTNDYPANTNDDPAFTVGVYLVTEQQQDGYTVAPPFFVTLPFTENGVWNYEQVVHPKNQADITIEKDVEDLGVTLGEEITYTISAPLPAGVLTGLSIVDDLPTELSLTDLSSFRAYSQHVYEGSVVTTDLTPSPSIAGNVLTVDFAPALSTLQGLSDANDNTNLQVFVEFQPTVISLPDNGSIENHASITVNGNLRYSTNPDDPDGPDEPGTGAETRLSQLTINKYNNAETPALITESAAEFELWRCQAEGEGFRVIGEKLSAATDADDVASVTTTFATGDEEEVTGQAILYGVQVLDWVNGDAPTADIGEDLCVVETKAPTGYSLNPEPQPVRFTTAPDDGYAMVADVTNLTTDEAGGGQLPSTGGMGTMALIAGGLVVAAAGGAAAVRGNRARS